MVISFKLKSSRRHHDLVDRYGISASQMTTDVFHLSYTLPGPLLIHDFVSPPGCGLAPNIQRMWPQLGDGINKFYGFGTCIGVEPFEL